MGKDRDKSEVCNSVKRALLAACGNPDPFEDPIPDGGGGGNVLYQPPDPDHYSLRQATLKRVVVQGEGVDPDLLGGAEAIWGDITDLKERIEEERQEAHDDERWAEAEALEYTLDQLTSAQTFFFNLTEY